MLITEEESKTKLCPCLLGYESETPGELECKGSVCMAWLWESNSPMDSKTRRGCCGLAGSPSE